MTFNAFDVVIVPFPFTDRSSTKRRPALVLSEVSSFNEQVGHSVLAMITSAKHSHWPLDVEVTDLASAGLGAASVVRMKLFTLDDQLIIGKAGVLADCDCDSVITSIKQLFHFKGLLHRV